MTALYSVLANFRRRSSLGSSQPSLELLPDRTRTGSCNPQLALYLHTVTRPQRNNAGTALGGLEAFLWVVPHGCVDAFFAKDHDGSMQHFESHCMHCTSAALGVALRARPQFICACCSWCAARVAALLQPGSGMGSNASTMGRRRWDIKNFIVPEGTFGTGRRARRTEWCALMVFLLVWVPFYVILLMLTIVVSQSGWTERMSVQSSYVNEIAPPYLVVCPHASRCSIDIDARTVVHDAWSPSVQGGDRVRSAVASLLPFQTLNISRVDPATGMRSTRLQLVDGNVLSACGCGQCLCLETARLQFGVTQGKTSFRDVGIQEGTTQTGLGARIQGYFGGSIRIRGIFACAEQSSHDRRSAGLLRVGLYGDRVPVSPDKFPLNASWWTVPIGTSTTLRFRQNHVLLKEQGLWTAFTSILYIWAPFIIHHHRYHPSRGSYQAEFHEYRAIVISKAATSQGRTETPLPQKMVCDNEVETEIVLEPLTFFQFEQTRVGRPMSILTAVAWVGVLLLLIHRIGAFFICFRRWEPHHPKLVVTPLLKELSGGVVAENHVVQGVYPRPRSVAH